MRQSAQAAAGMSWGLCRPLPGRAAGAGTESQAEPKNPGNPASFTDSSTRAPDLPDKEIISAVSRAATQNVLAALDPKVFFGYWSVCADREGFGRGNTYPSLDGHQMTDALLWLGQVAVVQANWNYVRTFQKPNGRLPLAILPDVKEVYGQPVETNGGFYTH